MAQAPVEITLGINDPIDPFQARMFSDGEDIYDGILDSMGVFTPPHELRSCLRFQWIYDDLLGGGPNVIVGEINDTYTVDTSSIDNSGDYYCLLTLGTQDCATIETVHRRVVIVECVAPFQRTVDATAQSFTAAIKHPHFAVPIFSSDSTWLTLGSLQICDTLADRTCESIANIDVASTLTARQGYVSLAVGTYVCQFAITQEYPQAPTFVPSPTMAPDPGGPSLIERSNDGPAEASDLGFNRITTKCVAWITGEANGDISGLSVTSWTTDNPLFTIIDITEEMTTDISIGNVLEISGTSSRGLFPTDFVGASGTVNTTIVVTDSNTGLSNTIPTIMTWNRVDPITQTQMSVLSGVTTASVSCPFTSAFFPDNSTPNLNNQEFTVGPGGGADVTFTYSAYPIVLQSPNAPEGRTRQFTVNVTGPGVGGTFNLFATGRSIYRLTSQGIIIDNDTSNIDTSASIPHLGEGTYTFSINSLGGCASNDIFGGSPEAIFQVSPTFVFSFPFFF